MDVAIIDYKMSNLFSVQAACEKVGLSSIITSDNNEILDAKICILPGVGAFGEAMKSLRESKLDKAIYEFVETGKPFVGICLGLQLLFDSSEEFGDHSGLGFIKGKVKKFKFHSHNSTKYPVPQIGWNKIKRMDASWEDSLLCNNTNDDFMYLGTVPYDFEDLKDLGIKDLNLKKINNDGINKIGMVINLDYHYQGGSHWVALYTDLKKNQIYFFDSFAKKPKKKIKQFINRLTKYLYKNNFDSNLNINNVIKKLEGGGTNSQIKNLSKFDIRFNNIQHQFKNSECGVYSINFIIRLAKGESFDNITKNITKDDDMNLCREVYFN